MIQVLEYFWTDNLKLNKKATEIQAKTLLLKWLVRKKIHGP